MNRRGPSNHQAQDRGVALVLVLCGIVLLTALIFVFFSRAQLDMQIAFSSANTVKADVFARSAADVVTTELCGEIADTTNYSTAFYGGGSTTNTNNYPAVYVPKAATFMVPIPQGVSSPSGSLIMASANNTPVRPNGTIKASSISTSTPSANGRYLTTARWFTSPNGSPQLGSQNTPPTWVFVTRGNGPAIPASITTAKDPTSSDYVTGRFAYAVYDTSGLLDANVAGYPPTFSATASAMKSSPAYADLSQIGMVSSFVTSFLSWRNLYSGKDPATFDEWATGIPRTVSTPGTTTAADPLALAAGKSGHLGIPVSSNTSGDRAVLSRVDLLNNTSVYAANLPAAPALTHFSRSVNAPSFCPPTAALVTATNPNLADARWTVVDPSKPYTIVTHYNDDGTTQTYNVQPGDPLLQRRFSLAKLAWITAAGPNTAAFASSADSAAAIKACFGLQWNNSPSDGFGARWEYVNANTSNAIKKLGEVASGNTEPNLFELLKAGIATGSLGLYSTNETYAMPDQNGTLDPSVDLQILRIGTNMIDCAGPDNFPTTVALPFGGIYFPVHGVKDLPYLSALSVASICSAVYPAPDHPTDMTQAQLTWATLFMLPVIFNPHRSGIAPVPATATPANVRIRIVSGINQTTANGSTGLVSGPLARVNIREDFSGDPPIVIPASAFEDFRSLPRTPQGTSEATSSTTLQSLLVAPATITATLQPAHGFIYYTYKGLPEDYSNDPSATAPSTTGLNWFRAQATKFLMVMEYQDTGGNWKIYDSMAGNEGDKDSLTGTGMGATNFNTTTYVQDFLYGPKVITKAGTVTKNDPTSGGALYLAMKIDPRTTRLGIPKGQSYVFANASLSTTPGTAYSTSTLGHSRSVNYCLPFGSQSAPSGTALYPELWASGNEVDYTAASSVSVASNAADFDKIVRPADGYLGGTSANLYADLTDPNRRPVILHRPFRSVGELGYVFRDSPWKTLNLVDNTAQTPASGTTGYTSADSALLDIFSVADEPPVSAGRLNLNGTQPLSQQALLAGAAQAQDGSSPLTSPQPANIASALNTYGVSATPSNPLTDVAQLTNFMSTLNTSGSVYPTNSTSSMFKAQRESVVRALAGNTQTRTWNLLIDVVAQTGRYGPGAASLNNFIVDGEKRYWLSVAIDRYTGKIVSRQLEPVNE